MNDDVMDGQVWSGRLGSRIAVETNPDEYRRVNIRDEKTGARSQVHTAFFSGLRLVEQRATIPCGLDQLS